MPQRILYLISTLYIFVFLSGLNSTTPTSSLPQVVPVKEKLAVEFQKSESFVIHAESANAVFPVSLNIPAINLIARILPVGLTEKQIVDTPEIDVGWFTNSARPGETGTIALNGHFKNADGSPGVFYNLANLKTGSNIYIENSDGGKVTYVVTETEKVTVTDFPLQKVYGLNEGSLLTIVTCAGEFDPQKEDYLERTIIYARLII